jgi:hypothetical protein
MRSLLVRIVSAGVGVGSASGGELGVGREGVFEDRADVAALAGAEMVVTVGDVLTV